MFCVVDSAGRCDSSGWTVTGGTAHPQGEREESARCNPRGGCEGATHGRGPTQPAHL